MAAPTSDFMNSPPAKTLRHDGAALNIVIEQWWTRLSQSGMERQTVAGERTYDHWRPCDDSKQQRPSRQGLLPGRVEDAQRGRRRRLPAVRRAAHRDRRAWRQQRLA